MAMALKAFFPGVAVVTGAGGTGTIYPSQGGDIANTSFRHRCSSCKGIRGCWM